MRFDLITIFPEFFAGPLDYGIVRRAREARLIETHVHDLRDFTHDRHRTVDDRPFGGGEGMVMKPEPLFEAVESLAWRESGSGTSRRNRHRAAVGGGKTLSPGNCATIREARTNRTDLRPLRRRRRARRPTSGDRRNLDWRFRAIGRRIAGRDDSRRGHAPDSRRARQ